MPMALNEVRVIADEFVFVGMDLRIAALHLEVLFGVPIADKGDADDAESLGSHVGELIGDIEIHAVDKGHDHNERGGGENDAKEGKKTAEFAFAQRIKGDTGGFPEGGGTAVRR